MTGHPYARPCPCSCLCDGPCRCTAEDGGAGGAERAAEHFPEILCLLAVSWERMEAAFSLDRLDKQQALNLALCEFSHLTCDLLDIARSMVDNLAGGPEKLGDPMLLERLDW